jgi:clathrin heavy chain
VKVLIVNIQDVKLATEYAEKVNQKDVWSELGLAQLGSAALRECIDAFIKAENAEYFERVINTAQQQNNYEELIPYLLMARANKKESIIDSELVFAYAMGGERFLTELEDFVREPNQADVLKCGERCFEQRLFLSAEILFKRINNNQKLAQTYVMLKKY